jgi:hypothetical protein
MALVAVLWVFLAPSIDLPDTVTAIQFAIATVLVSVFQPLPRVSDHLAFMSTGGFDAALDLLGRNRALRI